MPKKLLKTIGFIVIPFILSVKSFAGTTPPVTSITKDPSSPDGDNGWYVSPVTFTLNATDLESGVKEVNYKIDNGNWVKKEFSDTLNLASNPSFENTDITPPINTQGWKPNLTDTETSYTRDSTIYKEGFQTTSIKISSSSPATWHAINHIDNFAASTSYNNMNAAAWVKTSNAPAGVYFKIYAISENEFGIKSYTEIAQSNVVYGTSDWTQVASNFVVSADGAIGVYMEIGMEGSGTVWIDAVNINDSITSQQTSFSLGTDGNHTVQYYSVDRAGNIETTKSTSVKIDQTPPGGWNNSGAFRGLFGSSYQLWVYTNVKDPTSGLSTFTDRYQYHTELNDGFGKFSNILSCGSSWEADSWIILISPPFWPGSTSAYLLTPKTSFCNTNWNNPKIVRFYAKDMAGNEAYKEFVINGPWIKLRGEGIVKSENGIDMLSEAEGDNSDGLIEAANTQMDFFTTSKDWEIKNATPSTDYTYDSLSEIAGSKTNLGGQLSTEDGSYIIEGDLTINSGKIPSGYNTADFSNIIFVNGNLRIETNIIISDGSAVLFVVSGNVEIEKTVTEIDCGIFTDGTMYTAYNIVEGDDTEVLILKGIYTANKFMFQRTLQGVDNTDLPSEDFTYEPKYITKLRDYIGINTVEWLFSE